MKREIVFVSVIFLTKLLCAQDTVNQDSTLIERDSSAVMLTATGTSFMDYYVGQPTIKHLPLRDINELSLINPSAYYLSRNNMRFGGIEANGNYIIIDGMQVRDATSFPFRAIGKFAVLNNEAPIQLGNSIAGFVIIEPPLHKDSLFVSIEGLSGFRFITKGGMNIYPLGNDMIEINAGGPIRIGKRSKSDNLKLPSFYVAAAFSKINEPMPSIANSYEVKSADLANLENNPLKTSGSGTGIYENSEYITADQVEQTKVNSNSGIRALNGYFRVNYPLNRWIDLTLGSYIQYDKRRVFIYENAMFNSKNNPQQITQNFDNYLRLSHTLKQSDELKLSYQLQLNYSNYFNKVQSDEHKDNFFNYGYVGKFTTYKTNSYKDENGNDVYGIDSVTGKFGLIHQGWRDTLYSFEASDINPLAANVTKSYYSLYADPAGNYESYDQVILGGGLVNGWSPGDLTANVFDLWYSPGKVYNFYSKTSQQQLKSQLVFDLSHHKMGRLKFGAEYSKNTERSYQLQPVGLWRLMEAYTNFHITELDKSNPQMVYYDSNGNQLILDKDDPVPSGAVFQDTIFYNRLYNGSAQYLFDYNLRKKLGLATNGVDWIDVNALPPETFSLDMLSPDELLNNGSSFVSYYGYDHMGNKIKSNPSLDDFFNQTTTIQDYNGPAVYNRSIGAFRPNYFAGFARYFFTYKWIDVKIGLRVDRYDADQPVLKDPYLLFPATTAGEVREGKDWAKLSDAIPSGIGDDYVVYVDDIQNPGQILGFRDGDTWYNNVGTELQNADPLIKGIGIQPYLLDPNKTESAQTNSSAFENYEPAINFLPSVSLDLKLFKSLRLFGHYNSFTQNPGAESIFRPDQYLFVQSSNQIVNNPALKPLRADKFRIGLKQRVFDNFYGEAFFFRYYFTVPDVVNIVNAYPISYTTYQNSRSDNSGVTVSIKYRSIKNSGLNAGFGFTEQLFNSGLSNDISQIINGYAQFNFGYGEDYIGFITKNGKKPLKNLSLGVFLHYRKGARYSQQWNVTKEATMSSYTSPILKGSIYQYSMPYFSFVNLKIEKGFYLIKNKLRLDVYFWFQNLFNRTNIFEVYGYTGSPSDDGYLSDPGAQVTINTLDPEQQQAFIDQYSIKVDDPSHYDKPRIFHIGMVLRF